jgi:hypothetical protein
MVKLLLKSTLSPSCENITNKVTSYTGILEKLSPKVQECYKDQHFLYRNTQNCLYFSFSLSTGFVKFMIKYEHVSSINNIKPKHCKYTQCNVFVNRVFLHTLFLYVICVNVGFKQTFTHKIWERQTTHRSVFTSVGFCMLSTSPEQIWCVYYLFKASF